jgi:plastocyanin
MRRILIAMASMALVACADPPSDGPDARRETSAPAAVTGTGGAGVEGASTPGEDPRERGLRVALGEWALTLEAQAIRPGRVTFVVSNRGTMAHGFEIESEGADSSGSGSGDDDGIKAETGLIHPGRTARLTLDLPAGLYKVECLVEGHDDMGMEGLLEVRKDAPLVGGGDDDGRGSVSITGFAFDPPEIEVAAGSRVTWTNDDPTPHTVTAEGGAFDSGAIDPGGTFSLRIEGDGPISYRCSIHPDMTGTITIA